MGGGESLCLAEMHCTAFLREDGGAGPTWRDRAAQLQDVITFLQLDLTWREGLAQKMDWKTDQVDFTQILVV